MLPDDACPDADTCAHGASPPDDAHRETRRRLLVAIGRGATAMLALPLLADDALAALPAIVGEPRAGHERAWPIPLADGVAIDREESVIVARSGNQAWVFALSCPHQNTALRWSPRDARFQCPKHKSRYRPDGTFIQGRATRGMDRFAVRRDGDRIVADLDRLYRDDRDAAGWRAAVVRL